MDSTRSLSFPETADLLLADAMARPASTVDPDRQLAQEPLLRVLAAALASNQQLRSELAALEARSSTDRLTGAWNRARLEEAARGEMQRLERYGHPVALVFFDLDHFKQVNDTHGHAVGDRVLVETVAAVRRVCRTMDMVGRWGGEEFVVLAPNTGLDGATILAERLRRALAALDLPQVGSISASFGVAACHGTDTLESWLERADRAAYRAKRGGRNRVEVATTPSGDGATVEHVHAGFVQLVWSPAYASGHPVIDGQHQGLFRRANDLFDAVLDARPADEADAALDALVRDLVTHFQDEERIILQVGYPDTARHARVHAILLARTDERIQAFRGHRSGIGDLIGFLAHDVVLHHLLAEDRRFFPYLA